MLLHSYFNVPHKSYIQDTVCNGEIYLLERKSIKLKPYILKQESKFIKESKRSRQQLKLFVYKMYTLEKV